MKRERYGFIFLYFQAQSNSPKISEGAVTSTFSDLSPLFTQRGFKVKPWLSSARSVTSPHTHTVSFPSDRGEDVSLTSCCHTHRQEISNLLYCKFSKLHAALDRKMILFLLPIVTFVLSYRKVF